MMIRQAIVFFGLLGLFIMVMLHRAEARQYSHQAHHSYNNGYNGQFFGQYVQKRKVAAKRYKKTAKRKKPARDANGNIALAIVKTADGLTSRVAAAAQERFQGFINDVERDRDTIDGTPLEQPLKGNRIKAIGCYTPRGHMPGSKHHWGGACDIMQKARNITAAFMYHVTDIARRHGLTDGAGWTGGRGRYAGPDAGHIEVPGPNSPRKNQFAQASRNIRVAGR